MENPGFYAILPASVRYDNRLKAAEKILYCEITALSDVNGYCHAGNEYFAGLYGVDERTVRRWIHALEALSYVQVAYDKQGDAQVRKITPCPAVLVSDLAVSAPDKIVRHPRTKLSGTPGQNCPHNNTSINNTRDNNTGARARGRARNVQAVFDEFAAKVGGDDQKLQLALMDFVAYRGEIKKPLSAEGAVRACAKLDKLATEAGVRDRAGYMVAVIDQSILRNWDGLYPLKEDFADTAPAAPAHTPPPAPRQIAPDEDITKYF